MLLKSSCDNFSGHLIRFYAQSERRREGRDRFMCHCPIGAPLAGALVGVSVWGTGEEAGGREGGLAKCLEIFFCLVSVWPIGGWRGWQ